MPRLSDTATITRRTAIALIGSALLPRPARAAADREPPYFRALIEAGKMPELTLRLATA